MLPRSSGGCVCCGGGVATTQNKYNKVDNIIKLIERTSNRCGDLERFVQQTKVVFSIGRFGNILITQQQHRLGGKGHP